MNTSKQVRTIRAVLTPEMRKIMDRWGNPEDGNPGTLIFKFATGKEDGFATKHLVDTVIQKCNKVLGRIAENYLASFERDERMRNAQLLTKFD